MRRAATSTSSSGSTVVAGTDITSFTRVPFNRASTETGCAPLKDAGGKRRDA
jgi:hypothetical protein